MIKLGYIILYVNDVKKAAQFYMDAFGFEAKFISPENDYGELQTGETTIAFASKALGKTNLTNGFLESSNTQQPFGIELALVTEHIDATMSQAVKAGASIAEAPKQKPWGQTVAYLRDPDGFLIELCTPMDA